MDCQYQTVIIFSRTKGLDGETRVYRQEEAVLVSHVLDNKGSDVRSRSCKVYLGERDCRSGLA